MEHPLRDVDRETALQAEEYVFPYHYLPVLGARCSLTRQWNFAPSYLAALELVIAWMKRNAAGAATGTGAWDHIDIGCGDGALIYHLSHSDGLQPIRFHGVDRDAKAIAWARMFNRAATLHAGDLGDLRPRLFDSASLIEVAEHVPPAALPLFLKKCADLLRPGAQMVVTVPSKAKALSPKHYQHFALADARRYFSESFDIESIVGFERYNLPARILARMIYRSPVRIESPGMTRYLVDTLARTSADTQGCGRLFLVLRKRS